LGLILAAIKITRPPNCLAGLSGALLGGLLSGHLSPRLWLAAAVVACLTAAGNVVNDYFDVEIDRINKPQRVLPSGQMSLRAARRWAACLVVAGLGLAIPLGWVSFALAAVMAALLFVYSRWLKSSFLIGNVLVAFMSGMAVVYGGLAVGHVVVTFASAMVVLLFMLCREILKTVEDYEGDLSSQVRTVAVVIGREPTLRVFAGLAIVAVGATQLPWLMGHVSKVYPLLIVPGVDVVLLVGAALLLRRPTQRRIQGMLTATKVDWLVWVVAMFAGLTFRI
jgi:geranylgeranylglycerol-phosphate geranylgeranyltransferase